MMRQMRENTKWIMLVTAIAFVALMVFEWGMDITGRSGMGMGEIGMVNDDPVMYEEYINTYRNLYEQVQASQDDPITSQQNREIEDQAWDEVVNQMLIRQELGRRGIEVTDREIRDAARYSPPPWFREDPAFQTDGQFDLQKYQEFLASPGLPPDFLLGLEAYYRDIIPRGKLMRQVTTGIYIPDTELWRSWRDANETVTVEYLSLEPERRIPDSMAVVSDREVEAYYEEHRDDFAVPAEATVKVVALDKAPTAADTAATLERVRTIRDELLAGADFGEMARRESSDSVSAREGGALGTFGRGDMVAPFEEAAFAAPVGEVTEPVQTRFGYHLIEVTERWADSVQARHILVPIERTDDSELDLLVRADSLEELSEDFSLEEAASRLGVEVRTVEVNEVFSFAPGVGSVGEGLDWALEEAAPGEASPVFENQQAFYAFELVQASPAGHQSLEEATPTIRRILTLRKKIERATEIGAEIARQARQAGALEAAAAARNLEVRRAGPFTRTEFVEGLGRQNAVIGTAFGLGEGQVSAPVEAENDVFILRLVERTPADSASWASQKEDQRARLMQTIRQQRLQQWLEGLRSRADIEDRREEVFRRAEDSQQASVPTGGLF